ncbi:MAG: anthranilate phosphoribosyltransferase [Candidatus Eremiobacteraeota bacterium]|nr:anthranilate phosphoribosyltransferase [Candidatus Eremiobacteraeota bacterium]MCW5868249.1 anthranilate phosphoribosyltransferase [Candidatus Eremiobacteraeota bacterium]
MSALQTALHLLSQGCSLSREQAREATRELAKETAREAQIGAFLMALRVKGETREEIWGCAEALQAMARPVDTTGLRCVDTCGTGGDGSATLNLSTLSAFVAAAAGLCVAKHGNRSVTSECGSADLVEELGLPLQESPEDVRKSLQERKFAFLFAPFFHSATARVMQVRRSLGIRTIFNLLGPLTNPCRPPLQVIGVPEPRWCQPIAWVLAQMGVERALVVCGHGGVDELVLHGPNQVCLVENGEVQASWLDPAELGLAPVPLEALRGGAPDYNAGLSRLILRGEHHPATPAVALNAAAVLLVGGLAADWKEALATSQELLRSGIVWNWLESLPRAQVD